MTAICILFVKNHTVDLADADRNHRLLTAPIQAASPSVICNEDPATCKAVIPTRPRISPRISKRKYGPAFIFFVGLYYLKFFIEGLDYYHWQDQLFVNTPYKIDKGHASVTEAPGWGVEINPAWLEASHYQKLALADMPGLEVHR